MGSPPPTLTTRTNEPRSRMYSFVVYGDLDELEQPSCCQSIWQSIKDCFRTCFLHCQCIGRFGAESEDYFFDTSSQPLQQGYESEENLTQNPNMETGTSIWGSIWGTGISRKVARAGADGSTVARTGVQGRKAGGTADRSGVARTGDGGAGGSVVARTRTDDNAAVRKDKGPSCSKNI